MDVNSDYESDFEPMIEMDVDSDQESDWEPKIKINVVNLCGEVYPAEVWHDLQETVEDFKRELERCTSIPSKKQVLILEGGHTLFEDKDTLDEREVNESSRLLVVNEKEVLQEQSEDLLSILQSVDISYNHLQFLLEVNNVQKQLEKKLKSFEKKMKSFEWEQSKYKLKLEREMFNCVVVDEEGHVNNVQEQMERLKKNPHFMARINIISSPLYIFLKDNNVDKFEHYIKQKYQTLDRLEFEAKCMDKRYLQVSSEDEVLSEEEIEGDQVQHIAPKKYVKMKINGVEIKVCVDPGVQMSIMTEDCVINLNLTDLMEQQQQKMAIGVGTAEIVGRIQTAPIMINEQYAITCAITVLRQKNGPEFVFGLDMLNQHLCCMDFSQNFLRFASVNVELSFLTGDEILAAASEGQKSGELMENIPSSSSNAGQNPPVSQSNPSQGQGQGQGQTPVQAPPGQGQGYTPVQTPPTKNQ